MVFYSLPRGWKPHKTQALASLVARIALSTVEYRVLCNMLLRRTETEGPLVCCARSDVSSRHPTRTHRLSFSLPPATRRLNQPGGRSSVEVHTKLLALQVMLLGCVHANLSRTLRKSGRERGASRLGWR
jgi:hypothetical protein